MRRRTSLIRGVVACAFGALLGAACGETVERGGPPADSGSPPDSTVDTGTPPPPPSGSLASTTIEDGAGNSWRVTGEAITAPSDLASVPGHNAFWFAWSIFHPGTPIFDRDEVISGSVPPGDDECTVPCEQIAPACGGRDCIPSLQSPRMVTADSAEISYLRETDEILGVVTPEGPRAYPHNILWWHEIVNEEVGGTSFTVTFCPLTGSGLLYDRAGFVPGEVVELGVSGNLYNSNLVMYDRTTESFWSQMRNEAVFGPRLADASPQLPIFEMTWRAWLALHPDTLVVSSDTGHSRDYTAYPYGAYREDHSNTFRRTDPPPDPTFENKQMTFGLFAGDEVKAYVWDVLVARVGARRGLVQDEVGGVPVAIVFDVDERYVHAFDRTVGGAPVDLSLAAPE